MRAEYDTPELNESPPDPPIYERLVRNILADKPRVTRYQIDWSILPGQEAAAGEGEEAEQAEEMEDAHAQQQAARQNSISHACSSSSFSSIISITIRQELHPSPRRLGRRRCRCSSSP